ncbi:MAG TPA: SGNH/GDSL hydrolase family protein [Candidatus Dormibacteraeota bacterium]|nr:SGNH/GDSL hydrolase family protein [Candidatus Dormibacteraeota bacterium]
MIRRASWLIAAAAAAFAGLGGLSQPAQAAGPGGFSGTWAASPMLDSTSSLANNGLNNQTVRDILHTSVAGSQVRVRLSNVFGNRSVTFSAASIGVRSSGATLVSGSVRALLFGGRASVTVAAGQEVFSDATAFTVSAPQDLAVSVAVSGASGPATEHAVAQTTNFLTPAGSGNHTADVGAGAFTSTTTSWLFVDGVDVLNTAINGSVVALGDSITDGVGSTRDLSRRWPNFLAQRLRNAGRPLSVVDEGISGNALMFSSSQFGQSALTRLSRDVLGQTGVRDVIVLEGINDIGGAHDFNVNQFISAYQQIISSAHSRGLRVIGGTLLPFKNAAVPNYYTTQGDTTRMQVNNWIRTSGAFDGVVDFDTAMRSPSDPLMLNPTFDSGDHLHPNDAGYQAMANAINLALLT